MPRARERARLDEHRLVLPIVAGVALVAAFVLWELRAASLIAPMHLFGGRTFALTNVASVLMFFWMLGSIFLLSQFLIAQQGLSPLTAGIRILPWTAMPTFVASVAGLLSDRIGGQRSSRCA